MSSGTVLYILFFILISYFVSMALYYLVLACVGFSQSRKRALESHGEDCSVLRSYDFSAAVSIIVPAHNEELWISDCLKSLLNLDYPKFEIIVVNDSSTDRTPKILDDILDLKSDDRRIIRDFPDGNVHEVFRSARHPSVTVVRRSGHDKKAGPLNAGLNYARYKYICAMDADTVLEPNALRTVMMHIEKNPDKIIGAGSYFGMVNGFKIKDGKIVKRSFSYNPLVAYQNIEYLRTFIGNRLSWSFFNTVPILSGGFSVWRHDVVIELEGYDASFTCEDIEFTFRVYDYGIRNKKGYEVLSLPYYVGWTEGPSTVRSLISQRERWQRVTSETVWRYKYMMLNPRYKRFAFIVFPYFILYEVLGVYFEVVSIGVVLWAFSIGMLDLRTFFAYFILMAFSQAAISLLVLFSFLRDQKPFSLPYTAYLIFLSIFEFLSYRWIISLAKLIGTFKYLFGIKAFTQYNRSTR